MKNKKITLYMIIIKEDNEYKVHTITATKDQCLEYVEKYSRIKYQQHFDSWCDCHNIKDHDEIAWRLYCRNVLSEIMEDVYFKKRIYSIEEVAEIFRSVNKYVPIGCSYESSIEKLTRINKES